MLQSLQDLPHAPKRGVIINVGTKEVACLALMSALKYLDMPILVIDCESKDGSMDFFCQLQSRFQFDLLSAPLKLHGLTLDWLFSTIKADAVFLLDSDAEIVDPFLVSLITRFIDEDGVFGCGFTHDPGWLTTQFKFTHEKLGWYQERPWIPCTMLKTAHVREALAAGHSFLDKTVYNDFTVAPLISRLLHKRFRIGALQHTRLNWLNLFKNDYYGHKPSYVYYDTGADVYQFLKYQQGYAYVGLPASLHMSLVKHFHGITRRALNANDLNSQGIDHVYDQVVERLATIYGIDV